MNIQAAFAGVFSSNRLDLGKVFSDGLLLYAPEMEKFAHNFHGMTGYAADHPHPFYYCVEPWCAQYLWFQYEYSQDKEYLRKEAYPFFLKVAEFLTQMFEYDPADGYYHVYPDISPEQGPLAHDTTITVASSKYLLMPLFPVAEFDLNSNPEMIQILFNTVDFLKERCEIGVFQGSWMAASAARLGRGQTCLRLLYERVIELNISTKLGYRWKLNYLFINAIKGY